MPEDVNNDPTVANEVTIDLNTGSSPGNNPWAIRIGVQTPKGKVGGVIGLLSSGARDKSSTLPLLDFLIAGRANNNPFICSPVGINQIPDNEGKYIPLIRLLDPIKMPPLQNVSDSPFARVGDTEMNQPIAGDGNGFLESYEGYTLGDPNITRVQFGNGPMPTSDPGQGKCSLAPVSPIAPDAVWDHFTDYPAWHDVMFTNPDIRKYVVTTLTGKTPPPKL